MINDKIDNLKTIHDIVYEMICFMDYTPEKRLELLDSLKIYEKKIKLLERHPERYKDLIHPKIFKAYSKGRNTYEYLENRSKD